MDRQDRQDFCGLPGTVIDRQYRSNQIQESCLSGLSMFEFGSRLREKDGRATAGYRNDGCYRGIDRQE